jgi:hypothetical protein
MSHYTSDDNYPDLLYSDDYREYLVARSRSAAGYTFGRVQGRRFRARGVWRRVNRYFKGMIEAIANAKLRRMQRELELRGIRFDRSNNDWVAPKSRSANRSSASD